MAYREQFAASFSFVFGPGGHQMLHDLWERLWRQRRTFLWIAAVLGVFNVAYVVISSSFLTTALSLLVQLADEGARLTWRNGVLYKVNAVTHQLTRMPFDGIDVALVIIRGIVLTFLSSCVVWLTSVFFLQKEYAVRKVRSVLQTVGASLYYIGGSIVYFALRLIAVLICVSLLKVLFDLVAYGSVQVEPFYWSFNINNVVSVSGGEHSAAAQKAACCDASSPFAAIVGALFSFYTLYLFAILSAGFSVYMVDNTDTRSARRIGSQFVLDQLPFFITKLGLYFLAVRLSSFLIGSYCSWTIIAPSLVAVFLYAPLAWFSVGTNIYLYTRSRLRYREVE